MGQKGQMNRYERRVVSYASAAHGLIHVMELTYAAVLVVLALEFGSGLFLLGLIANLAAFAFGAGALPAGVLADRLGSKRVVIACLVGAAVMSVLVSLSPSIYVLAVALTGLGLAIGLYHPAGMAFIARGVRKRAMGLGYHGMGGNFGVALAPFFAGSIAALWGWRAAYLVLAGLALLLVAMMRIAPVREEEAPPEIANRANAGGRVEIRAIIVPLLVLYISYMFTGFIYRGTVTFLPLYIGERVHLSLFNIDSVALAGSFTTLALLFGIGGQYLGGFLAERVQLERLLLPVSLVTTLSLLLIGATRGGALVFVAAIFAFGYFMGQPIYSSLIAEYTPHHLQGRSYGISFFSTFGLGSFAAGVSGYIAERLGINWVFFSLAGFGLLLLGLALYLLWTATSRAERRVTSGEESVA